MMRIPTPVLFVLLGAEYVLGCTSGAYVFDIGIEWPIWLGFGALSLWFVLFLAAFAPTFNAIVNRDAL